ncbi:MAG: HD domain-containing protein [Patescibacteria group bacterium]
MNKSQIRKVRDLVRREAESEDWKYHIAPVASYARKLAKVLGANQDLAELAALLHDIGRIRFSDDEANHHLTGIPEAEKILKNFKFSSAVIEEVKHCVASHRSSRGERPKTVTAKIIANADGLAHFDILPLFFYWRSKKQSFDEALIWVERKLAKSWHKKLTLPQAKKMVKDKYQRLKLILEETKKLTRQ